MANTVSITVRANDKASGEIDKIKNKFQSLTTSKGFQSAAMGVGMSVGTAAFNALSGAASAAADFLGDSVTAASDMTESVSKMNTVFGESAAGVRAWSKTAAMSMGMSQQAALEAAGTLGNLFTAMEIGQPAAAEMSQSMIALAADLASFNNASPEDTLLALRSGLIGESEPLRKFGINLSAATIAAKAMEMGLADSTKELTAADKAQAAYALILEQSTTAQGDFTRTSDGLANQQRITDAKMADLSATIGAKLMPVFLAAQQFMVDTLIPAFEAVVEGISPIISSIVDSLMPAFELLGKVIPPIWDGIVSTIKAAAEVIMAVIGPIIDAMRWIIDNILTVKDAGASMPTGYTTPATPGGGGTAYGTPGTYTPGTPIQGFGQPAPAPASVNIAPGAINVNGVGDPEAVARAVMLALKRETQRQGMAL